jgi:preprotein translocase subunit SecF
MSRLGDIPGRLYRGEISVNIVSRQKMWYLISGAILVISIAALLIRGLNFSVEFKGGSVFEFPAPPTTSSQTFAGVVSGAGGGSSSAQFLGGKVQEWEVTTGQLTSSVSQKVANALGAAFHVPTSGPHAMSVQFIGPTWGSSITSKALEALIIFLIVIVIYLSVAFEWKMAVAAFVALLHDILITVGVYALIGFSVSPTSVIGLLTILGYSLYDTVVVFDKVRENTAGLVTSERSTYSQAANLALNQTLVRSINTSLTALIPIASILFIGDVIASTPTLNDLSLVLFVGMLSGTYSSLCIATPVLADLKEREPAMRKLRERVTRREAGGRAAVKRAESERAEAEAKTGTAQGGTGQAGTRPAPVAVAVDDRASVVGVTGTAAGDDADDDTDDMAAASSKAPSAKPAAPRTTVRQQSRGGSANRKKRR